MARKGEDPVRTLLLMMVTIAAVGCGPNQFVGTYTGTATTTAFGQSNTSSVEVRVVETDTGLALMDPDCNLEADETGPNAIKIKPTDCPTFVLSNGCKLKIRVAGGTGGLSVSGSLKTLTLVHSGQLESPNCTPTSTGYSQTITATGTVR